MKNNNHGFIAMSIIYSIFIFFIMGLVSIMFIYISDRKTSSRVKDDIKNQFNANAPHVLLSMEGSNQSQDSYSVTISVQEDKYSIASLNYAWTNSKETTEPNIPFTANSTINSPLTRGNWYLHVKVCDTYGNCSYVVSDKFKVGSTVCKRATTLHTEICRQDFGNSYCSGHGFRQGGTITYGNIGTTGNIAVGDAFTCDVNGDEIYDEETERFYYLTDMNSNIALLVYYNNVSNGEPSNETVSRYFDALPSQGPLVALRQLPTTSQWSNVSLTNNTRNIKDETGTVKIEGFSYEGYAARLITYNEVNSGCYDGTTAITGSKGLFNKCFFLMENTIYATPSLHYGFWLETPDSSESCNAFVVHVPDSKVESKNLTTIYFFGVRPVIEVPKSRIEL